MFDPLALLGRLVEGDVDFVVIGGLAATIHGAAIPTRDLHVMYDRAPANLEHLAAVLAGLSVRLRGAEGVIAAGQAGAFSACFTNPSFDFGPIEASRILW